MGYSNATWGSPVRAYTSSNDAYAAKLSSSGELTWNTFLGDSGIDYGKGIAVDGSGNVYVGGYSSATWGSPVRAYTSDDDAFAAKLNSSGALTWNTFLGGSETDQGYGIAVDGSGNVYVSGYSTATWGSPVRAYSSGYDAFAAKLSSGGALTWNTFLGGSRNDYGRGIAVDGSGNVYVVGYSWDTWGDSPVRAYTSSIDAFAAKLSSGGALTWNTFLGGGGTDYGYGIAVDGSGNVYVTGVSTATWGSPIRAFSYDKDAFAAKLSSSGELTWHAFLGGSGDYDVGIGIAVDGSGNVYVTGVSQATWGNSPVRVYTSGYDAFAAMIGQSSSPTVTTTAITNIGSYTATGGGNVSSDGGASVTARGVCWKTSSPPTIADDTTKNGTGTGAFTSSLTGLSAETRYYVKAYAINVAGTAYGSEVDFWTYSIEPSAHPASFSAVGASTTSLNLTFSAASTISNCDGYIILRRSDTYPDATNINDGTAPGSLSMPGGTTLVTTITNTSATSYENTGLTTGNTYYYTIIPFNWNSSNSETYNYYTGGTLKTASAIVPDLPTVTTASISNIAVNSASSGGNVTDDGDATVTIRGVCWKTSSPPTIADDTTKNGTGTGTFTSSLTGLSAETRYYVKAYATNVAGTNYGSEENFWTYSDEPSAHPASFSAAFASTTSLNLTFSAASTISNCDGYIILRRTDTYPDATNINDGTAPGSLSLPGGTVRCTTVTVTSQTAYENTGLTTGQTYYYALIPFNSNGTNSETYNYKTDGTIKTAAAATGNAPTVATTTVSSITTNTASSGGNVTDDGGLSVTVRGVCWNTSTSPTIANDTTQDGDDTGEFISSLTGLTAATHYYLRAYSTNAVGTSYGDEEEFYTLSSVPTTQASIIIWQSATRSSIGLQWINGNGDGRIVICKQQSSISSSPLTNGTDYDADASYTGSGSSVDGGKIVYNGTGNSVTITSLTRNRLYYFKVFEYNGSNQTIAYNQSNATGNPNNRMTSRRDPVIEELVQPEVVINPTINLDIMSISPNPAKDNLSIEFKNNISKSINISLFTYEGQLVRKYSSLKSIGNTITLNLKDLASGQYNLIIFSENELVYGSFVIQR